MKLFNLTEGQMGETEISDLKAKMKRELRLGMILAPVVISLILGTANIIAQKMFYTDKMEKIEKRTSSLEKRANDNDEFKIATIKVLERVDFNVQELCKKNKVEYKRFPKVYDY